MNKGLGLKSPFAPTPKVSGISRRIFGAPTVINNKTGRKRVIKTLTAFDPPWVAPLTTYLIASMTARGGAGDEGFYWTHYYVDEYTTDTYRFTDSPNVVVDGPNLRSTTDYGGSSPSVPANYCDPQATNQNVIAQRCYSYQQRTVEEYAEPTVGQNTIAFGRTFPGGLGGPGATYTLSNVAVQPGKSHHHSIDNSGLLQIVYYE